MRVSRIRNVAWASNVLLLSGVAWTGLGFWHARNAKPASHGIRATVTTVDAGARRWPGERSAFDHISATAISGVQPSAPLPPSAKPEVDPTQAFKDEVTYRVPSAVKSPRD